MYIKHLYGILIKEVEFTNKLSEIRIPISLDTSKMLGKSFMAKQKEKIHFKNKKAVYKNTQIMLTKNNRSTSKKLENRISEIKAISKKCKSKQLQSTQKEYKLCGKNQKEKDQNIEKGQQKNKKMTEENQKFRSKQLNQFDDKENKQIQKANQKQKVIIGRKKLKKSKTLVGLKDQTSHLKSLRGKIGFLKRRTKSVNLYEPKFINSHNNNQKKEI